MARGEAATAAVRILPVACITRGRRGTELADLVELAAAGAVAFSDDGSPVADAQLFRNALEYARAAGRPIFEHSQDLALSAGGVMHEGVVSARLGLPGIPAAAEESAIARDLALARLSGGAPPPPAPPPPGGLQPPPPPARARPPPPPRGGARP